jgi:ElaA protein
MPECSVVTKSWGELTTEELYSFLKLRTDVFFVEQKVDEEELDYRDLEPTTEHYWVADESGAISYLRTLFDETPEHRDAQRVIGRVVVRADRRGEGLSSALMREVIAKHGHEPMLLHAQEYVVPMYSKFGFEPFGDVYVEAGIRHQSMYREPTPAAAAS